MSLADWRGGELMGADERHRTEVQLEARLLDGLRSAESELTPADWTAIHLEGVARVENTKVG